jgi:hypothetical protein
MSPVMELYSWQERGALYGMTQLAASRVYTDRANADLVARERAENRPFSGANIRERVGGFEAPRRSSPA